jgi:hypothetical protein
MGKKKHRKAYTSKGQRPNISAKVLKLVENSMSELDKALIKVRSWKKGQNLWITIMNPSGQTNKRFIKVKSNSLWGDPNKRKQSEDKESEYNV